MSVLGRVCFDMMIEDLKEDRKTKKVKFAKEYLLEVEETGYEEIFQNKKEAMKQFKIANEIYVPELWERIK